MTMYEKIKMLCEKEGFSISAIGDHIEGLSITRSSVSRWKDGMRPRPMTMKLIAEHFHKPMHYFFDDPPEPLQESNVSEAIGGMVMLPLYESVSAGHGAYANSEPVGTIPTFLKNPADAPRYYCITVKGDSMYPKIEDGDIVQVERSESVDSGSLAAVCVDGDEGFVKRIILSDDEITLESINPMYPPMRFKGAEQKRVTISGRVRKIMREI